jgi:hypothetical protein
MHISKRDAFMMSESQALAGRSMWQRTAQEGRLCSSTMDAEATAPKTWLLWVDSTGREHIVECELYVVGRASDSTEGIGMLHGMCPCCKETFIVREDNKEMDVEFVPYYKAPRHIRQEWRRHCRMVLDKRVSDKDKIAIVSSRERWMCDYCHGWCVRVADSVAVTDTKGATKVFVDQRPSPEAERKIVF